MNKKSIAFLSMAICIILVLTACSSNNQIENSQEKPASSLSETISFSDTDESTINTEEQQIAVFTAKIQLALKESDSNAFVDLIPTDKFNVITVYGGEGVVYSVAHQRKDQLTIEDGELIYHDPQVNPSELETGLNADMFENAKYLYKLNEQKEGLLENIDWDNADKDYLTAHFHAFYDQMAWLIDEWNIDNWVVYKLTNDTYLYSKSYSYYSEDWGARVFVGQSFVIKRDGDKLGIVAYIDAK